MDNIRLYRFLLLEEAVQNRYFNVFQFIAPVGIIPRLFLLWQFGNLKAEKLQQLSFGEIIMLKKYATGNDYEKIFQIVFGISESQLLRVRVKDFFQALNWIKNELEILVEREKLLNSEPDPKMMEAGIERLEVFREMNLLIGLMKDYGLPPTPERSLFSSAEDYNPLDLYAEWRYSTVFTLLYQAKISNDIDRNYAEIMRRDTP